MSLPKPINWLRGSREATGVLYLVKMIDHWFRSYLSPEEIHRNLVKNRREWEKDVGMVTPDELETVRNRILTFLLEVNPNLTAEGSRQNLWWSHFDWDKQSEDPDIWQLYYFPDGVSTLNRNEEGEVITSFLLYDNESKTHQIYKDFFPIASMRPYRINDLDL